MMDLCFWIKIYIKAKIIVNKILKKVFKIVSKNKNAYFLDNRTIFNNKTILTMNK